MTSNQFAQELRASHETIQKQEATAGELVDELTHGRLEADEAMDRARNTSFFSQQQDQAMMHNAEEMSYLTNELQNRATALAEMRATALANEDQSQQIAKASAQREMELRAEIQAHVDAASQHASDKETTGDLLRQQQQQTGLHATREQNQGRIGGDQG